MAKTMKLRRVSQKDLDALVRDPSDVYFILHGPEPEPRKGFFGRLFGGAAKETPPKREWQPPGDDMTLDLGERWQVLHYLLSNSAGAGPLPQASLVSGGVELVSNKAGMEPARALHANEVDAFLGYLDKLSGKGFGTGIDKAQLDADGVACRDWNDAAASAVWSVAADLRSFLRKAKYSDNGIVIYRG